MYKEQGVQVSHQELVDNLIVFFETLEKINSAVPGNPNAVLYGKFKHYCEFWDQIKGGKSKKDFYEFLKAQLAILDDENIVSIENYEMVGGRTRLRIRDTVDSVRRHVLSEEEQV